MNETQLTHALQRLVDRAEISDLMVAFGHALDVLDGPAYAATYLEDGVLEGFGFRVQGREALEAAVPATLGRYSRRWHITANHAIEIDGDRATLRAYAFGVHGLAEDDPGRHADLGGWYECTLRRVAEGWRFASVRINDSWVAGEPDLPH